MRTIRGKLIIVYLLIFTALALTVISSYIAVDTQKQHLILTELLSKQKLLIERVTFTTINAAETGLANKDRFKLKSEENSKSIAAYKDGVDFMLGAFTDLEYPLDGKIVTLKFRGSFLPIFDEAIAQSKSNWKDIKTDVHWLLDSNNLEDLTLYEQRLDYFRVRNKDIIDNSDYLTKICRDEANRKKTISTWVQMISIGISVLIFAFLIWFISNHFEKPITQIRTVFKHMARGDFEQELNREQDDEFRALFQDFNRFVESLLSIRNIEDQILSEDDLSKNLSFIQEHFKPFAPYEWIHLIYEDTSGRKVQFSQNQNEVLQSTVEQIEVYDKILQLDQHNIVLPIRLNDAYLGYARFESNTPYDHNSITFFKALKEKLSFTFYKSLLFRDLLAIVTDGLADLAESRDPETRQHLIRMSSYSYLIAQELSKHPNYNKLIDQPFLDNLKLTSPMHDIGKVSVPDAILLKPGKLTDDEYTIMKTHAFEGAVVLKRIHARFNRYNLNYFSMAADIAHCHQEKFDGSGYPNAVSGADIPLSARISALADVFDALTSKRPYKDAFSLEKSYGTITDSKGSHFDPDIVEAFFAAQTEIESVYQAYKET